MESSIFWDIAPCSPLKINKRFLGTCRPHLWYQRASQARNQHEAGNKQRNSCRTLGFIEKTGWNRKTARKFPSVPSEKQEHSRCYQPKAGCLLGFYFCPEDEGDIFRRNIG
jgi:hypothetical protein